MKYFCYCDACKSYEIRPYTFRYGVRISCKNCNKHMIKTDVTDEQWDKMTEDERIHILKTYGCIKSAEKVSAIKYVNYRVIDKSIQMFDEPQDENLTYATPFQYVYIGYKNIDWEKLSEEEQTRTLNNITKIIMDGYKVFVTTGDWYEPYEVIGPVYYQISNRGIFSTPISKKINEYSAMFANMRQNNTLSKRNKDLGFLYGNYDVGSNDFEIAFFIATEELKKKARYLGADAVICMRQDIDIETEHINNFYLQMYGTAIKFKK